METRKLNTRDLYTVGNMLRKVAPDLRKIQFEKGENESEEAHKARVGQSMFALLADRLYEDVWAWLASVANMSLDEMMDQPIEFVPELVEELTQKEDLGHFFTKVQGMVAKMN